MSASEIKLTTHAGKILLKLIQNFEVPNVKFLNFRLLDSRKN